MALINLAKCSPIIERHLLVTVFLKMSANLCSTCPIINFLVTISAATLLSTCSNSKFFKSIKFLSLPIVCGLVGCCGFLSSFSCATTVHEEKNHEIKYCDWKVNIKIKKKIFLQNVRSVALFVNDNIMIVWQFY